MSAQLPLHEDAVTRASPARVAVRDWVRAFHLWRLWTALGAEDLSDRYRRTFFGVTWVVTSFAAFVFVKVLVFGQMSPASFGEFAMFVTVGFGLWSYISLMVLDCCSAYVTSHNWLMGTSIPYPVFFLQAIYRNWLVFALTLLVMFGVLIWKQTHWTPVMFAAIPGLLSYMIAPMWFAAIMAPLCLRYRDVYHFMQTVMRLLFFITPILWMPGTTAGLAKLAKYNPVTHFIEIVRMPLVYNTVPWDSWAVVIVVNVLGLAIGAYMYASTRNKVAFWL